MIAPSIARYLTADSPMDNPRPANVTPTDFLQWREGASLNISPKFQRRGVWSLPQRSYFIDTILREMPCPPLYLRNVYSVRDKLVIHEVIDGQQRLRAVLDYMDGQYALSKSLDAPYSGKKFAELSTKQQITIRKYTFHCETFHEITDQEVFEVFRRMNKTRFSERLTS